MTSYISIKNWERFQHYRKGRPPWIKLYRDLLRDYEFMGMSETLRWTLVGLYLIAAETDNKIPHDRAWLKHSLNLTKQPDLRTLQTLGFIEVIDSSSNGLGKSYTKEEVEEDEEVEIEVETEKKKRTSYSVLFEEVWQIHRRGPKRKAYDEYRKADKPHIDMVVALESYVRHELSDRFHGHDLFRWIRDERWEQEEGRTSKPNGKPTAAGIKRARAELQAGRVQ